MKDRQCCGRKDFVADVDGATSIEYGLIAVGVAVAVAASVFLLGDQLNELFFSKLPAAFDP